MFSDFKKIFPKTAFWHFNSHFVLKTFIWVIFQITEKKQQIINNKFLANIWRNNWHFRIWRSKRTLIMYLPFTFKIKWYRCSRCAIVIHYRRTNIKGTANSNLELSQEKLISLFCNKLKNRVSKQSMYLVARKMMKECGGFICERAFFKGDFFGKSKYFWKMMECFFFVQ